MVVKTDALSVQAGQVDLWFFSTEVPRLEQKLGEYKALLSVDEQAQSEQLLSPLQCRDFILNRAMLRTVLSAYGTAAPQALDFSVNQFGKPQLSDTADNALVQAKSGVHFNTAYSGGISICAVAADSVGVDIESHPESAGMLAAADDYLSKEELLALRALPESQQLAYFFRYWTLKEAWLKARGEGLSVSLQDFSMLLDDDQIQFDGPEVGMWDFRLLGQNEHFTAAMAAKGTIETIRCFRAKPLGEASTLDSPEQAIAELASHHNLNYARRA